MKDGEKESQRATIFELYAKYLAIFLSSRDVLLRATSETLSLHVCSCGCDLLPLRGLPGGDMLGLVDFMSSGDVASS